MEGGAGVVCMRWRWQRDGAFDSASAGRGFWATSPKPRRWGSVSGALLKTDVEGDGGRCLGRVYEVEVAVGWCV
jgi:hypothetical protein